MSYDQQFTGADGAPWDGFDAAQTLGDTGGLADQQGGEGRIKLNTAGTLGYSNIVVVAKTMTAEVDGVTSGAFRVPAGRPDLLVVHSTRAAGGQPNYQPHRATGYHLYVEPAKNTVRLFRQQNEGAGTLLGSRTDFTMAAGDVVRFRREAEGGVERVRLWRNAEPEPTGWMFTVTDPNPLAAGIDTVGVRGEPAFDGGSVYWLHLTRVTGGDTATLSIDGLTDAQWRNRLTWTARSKDVTALSWSVVQRPQGSTAALTTGPGSASLLPDQLGAYMVRVVGASAQGSTLEATMVTTVRAALYRNVGGRRVPCDLSRRVSGVPV